MRELLKILAFNLVVILGFVGFATFGIPLVVPEPPPVEEKITGDITMDQYIAIGKKIFYGKGTCTLCHSEVGGRAPLLEGGGDLPPIGVRALDQIKDERYKGKATTGEEYIRESMLEPSAFVVSGFGKKGTNDTVSPMPAINKGAIGLSDVEMNAVISFLQSVSGVEVTVPLPSGDAELPGEGEEKAEIKPAESAEEAFVKFECVMCHAHQKIEEGGDVGPDLTHIAENAGKRKKGYTAEQYITESILDPNAYVVEDFDEDTMPADFAERMTISELQLMINALLGKETPKGEEPS